MKSYQENEYLNFSESKSSNFQLNINIFASPIQKILKKNIRKLD